MKFKGVLKDTKRDVLTGKINLHFEVENFSFSALEEIEGKELSIEAKKYKRTKTNAQNRLFWECVGQLAQARKVDNNFSVYLEMLRKYGQFTYIIAKANRVDAVKAQWRDCEVIGDIDIKGEKGKQLICYFGCSTYNVEEYSRLINGIIKEMLAEGLNPPSSEDMHRALEACKEEGNKSK